MIFCWRTYPESLRNRQLLCFQIHHQIDHNHNRDGDRHGKVADDRANLEIGTRRCERRDCQQIKYVCFVFRSEFEEAAHRFSTQKQASHEKSVFFKSCMSGSNHKIIEIAKVTKGTVILAIWSVLQPPNEAASEHYISEVKPWWESSVKSLCS